MLCVSPLSYDTPSIQFMFTYSTESITICLNREILKFSTITLCCWQLYILYCMYVLTLTYNSLQVTSNKEVLTMEASKQGERQGVVLKSKQLGL